MERNYQRKTTPPTNLNFSLPNLTFFFFIIGYRLLTNWEFIHFGTHELDRILDYLDIMCCSILVYLCLSKIKLTTVSRSLALYPPYSLSALSGCCKLLILRGLSHTVLYSSPPWSKVEVVSRSLLWLWTEVYTASLDCNDSFERASVCSPLSLFMSDFSTSKC